MHGLLLQVAADFECVAVCAAGEEGPTLPDPSLHAALGIRSVLEEESGWRIDCGYVVHFARDFQATLGSLLSDGRPTVLCTHLDRALETLKIGLARGAAGVWFLRDVNPEYHPEDHLREALACGTRFIANSNFVRDWARKVCEIDASVVYPSVNPTDCSVTWNPDGCIAMINPFPEKGGRLFFEIASLLPQERFMAVESWLLPGHVEEELKTCVAKLSNATLLRRVADIRTIYRQARLLLVPSLIEEAFGRVILEAQTSGIPVIASKRGGIPEALGEGGILVEDYRDARSWATLIRPLTAGSAELRALSALATRNSLREEFSIARNGRRFLEIVECAAGLLP
jgi:glycosyltransferase involved in cell wall biosynthesis